jgi:hypothetical protein
LLDENQNPVGLIFHLDYVKLKNLGIANEFPVLNSNKSVELLKIKYRGLLNWFV